MGYWIARHFYGHNHDRAFLPELRGAARTPVLFADFVGNSGKIGWLTVELFAGAGPLIPDPFSLGLTLLSRGKDGFHEAMQRAWWRSGLSDRLLHARWRLAPYWGENPNALAVPVLHGRSLEIAVCCALWAANGAAPDEAEHGPVELDDRAVVTAMFSDREVPYAGGPDRLKDAELDVIGGLPLKVDVVHRSAREHSGIDLVVLALGQEIDQTIQTKDGEVHIARVATIGKAFGELWALNKYTRAYQQQQIKPFREKYYFAPEEEPEMEMAGAEAE